MNNWIKYSNTYKISHYRAYHVQVSLSVSHYILILCIIINWWLLLGGIGTHRSAPIQWNCKRLTTISMPYHMTEFFSSPKVKLSTTTRLLDYNNKNTQVRVIFLSKRLVLLSSAGAGCVHVTFIYLYRLRVRLDDIV